MGNQRARAFVTAAVLLAGGWGASGAGAEAATGPSATAATASAARPSEGQIISGTADDGFPGVCALSATDPVTGKVAEFTPTGAGCEPSASPDAGLVSYIGPAVPDAGSGPITTPLALHVMDRDGTHGRVVYRLPSTAYSFDRAIFTPDGRHLLFDVENRSTDGNQLYRIGIDGKGLTPVAPGFPQSTLVAPEAYSPDGRTLAADVGGNLWLKAGNAKPYELHLSVEPTGAVSFSPSGRELAYGDGSAYLADLATGKVTGIAAEYQDAQHNTHAFYAATFSPDGRQVAVVAALFPWGAMGGFYSTVETAPVASPTRFTPAGAQRVDGELDSMLWLPPVR